MKLRTSDRAPPRRRAFAALGLLAALAGCAITEPRTVPAVALPAAWDEAATLTADADLEGVPARWWPAFGSPTLDALIDEGLGGSSDLRIGAERVTQAELALRQAGISRLPTLGASLGSSLSKSDGPDTGASERRSTSAALSVSYELDLWGRLAAGVQAGEAALEATRYDLDTLRISVASSIAASYFELLTTRERLRLARENLAVAERVLGVVEARYRNGVATALEVSQQRTTVLSQRGALIPLEVAERQTLSALALLIGRVPQGQAVADDRLETLRVPEPAPQLPSVLLSRRPDLAAAEADLRAADADVAAARAALLPSLGLSAGGSLGTAALLNLADPTASASLGLSLAQTLFDGGLRRSQIALAQSRRVVLVETYVAAVRSALKEVDDGLGNADRSRRQSEVQRSIVVQAQDTLRLAELRYREGSDDLLAVLDAQRTLFSAQDNLATLRLARLNAALDLVRALGGGWERPLAAAPDTTARR